MASRTTLSELRSKSRDILASRASWFTLSVCISILAHIAIFLVAISDLAASMIKPQMAGEADGSKEGTNIEIVDSPVPEPRPVVFKQGFDETDRQPQATEAKSVAATAPAPTSPPATAADTTDADTVPDLTASPLKPNPQSQSNEPISEADIAKMVENLKLDFAPTEMAMSRAGQARLGQASPFVRAVLRILKEKMPKPTGATGTVVVGILVSVNGDVEAIRILKSSGHPELDRLVVDGVRSTHLVAPDKGTPEQGRLFKITYLYD